LPTRAADFVVVPRGHAHMGKGLRVILIGVLLCAGVSLALTRIPEPSRTYSFTTVAAGLRQHPNAWLGRTIAVRGHAWATCTGCRHELDILADPANPQGSPQSSLLLIIMLDAPTAFVRHIPLVGTALAPPLHLPATGTYRIRIERDPKAAPGAPCGGLWCYRAILVPPF